MSFGISPGVYPEIEDLSEIAAGVATSIGAQVFASNRGSLKLKYTTNWVRFTNEYGPTNPTVGFGHDTARAFHKEGKGLWNKRVVGDGARSALGVYVNDVYAGNVYESTSHHAVPYGSEVDSDLLFRNVQDIVFTTNISIGHAFGITVNGTAIPNINYALSNNNTMRLIAQAIQNRMDAIQAGGMVYVVEREIPNVANSRIIRIISPQDMDINLTNPVFTGVNPPSAAIREAEWLFFEQIENPGVWGNNVATRISALDQGVKQRIRLTFSGPIVPSNSIVLVLNGITVTVPYLSNNNVTLEALCTAVEAAFPQAHASVITVQGTNNNREIIIVRPDSRSDWAVESTTVTGGASQAHITSTIITRSIASTDTFTYQVFEGTNLRLPREAYQCSLFDHVDGYGNQIEMEYQINDGPRKSSRIRIWKNDNLQLLRPAGTTPIRLSDNAGYLMGGADGNSITSAEVVQGWNEFSNPERVTVRLLINAGYATPEVQQKIVSIAESRRDCFAILDLPSDRTTAQDAVDYRNLEQNIDSYRAAMYGPDILIYDEDTNTRRYVPPSGAVAAQYAYSDRVRAEYFAPAGLNRGIIKDALGLRTLYEEGDRDLLSLNKINAIRYHSGRFPIWGEYTLQYKESALSSVPVVRMVISIEITLTDAIAYSVFEPNDPITRTRIKNICEDYLEPIRVGRGLVEYKIICDERNNTPETIGQRKLFVDVYLKPVLSALYIKVTSILMRQSSTFEEAEALRIAA